MFATAPASTGFVVMPRRCVVERTHAWNERARRLWCALSADSFEQGVITAVNHSGDGDSTGLIAGHLLGIQYGPAAIPPRWYEQLEMRDVIERVGKDIDRVPETSVVVVGSTISRSRESIQVVNRDVFF